MTTCSINRPLLPSLPPSGGGESMITIINYSAMTSRLRAVVVGTGFGCLTHVCGLRAAGFDVAGLVGRNESRTARRAKILGVPAVATDLSDALTRIECDCVSIATPPGTHAELVLLAAAAGRHVICEKPLAAS